MIVKRIKFYSDNERTPLRKVKKDFWKGEGSYFGRRAAHKADEEGATDEEILRRAKNAATKSGAVEGAVAGTVLGKALADELKGGRLAVKARNTIKNKNVNKVATNRVGKVAVAGTVLGTTAGLAGYNRLASHLNTKHRLEKRKKMDQNKQK
mgnify:CR=1 FL=1